MRHRIMWHLKWICIVRSGLHVPIIRINAVNDAMDKMDRIAYIYESQRAPNEDSNQPAQSLSAWKK